MKPIRYLRNLWLALTGRNPYKVELDRRAKLQKEREKTYQILVENLRQRIKDKDEQIAEQSKRYTDAVTTLRLQHKIAVESLEEKKEELKADLDATLDELQKVNSDIGREMMSANLLHKMNCALVDLLQAMESGSTEKMEMVVEYLSWNCILTQIAQCHLDFLKGKRKK